MCILVVEKIDEAMELFNCISDAKLNKLIKHKFELITHSKYSYVHYFVVGNCQKRQNKKKKRLN